MRVDHQLGFKELKNLVIERGLCHACGTCIGACLQQCLTFSYGEDDEAMVVEQTPCASCGVCIKVCPGADIPMPDLERFLFDRSRMRDKDLRIFLDCNASQYLQRQKYGWPTPTFTSVPIFSLPTKWRPPWS